MNANPRKRALLVLSAGLACYAMTLSGALSTGEKGTVVEPGGMPEFYQNAAAEKYQTELENITTNNAESRDFGTLIVGSVDTDTNTFYFDCRFDHQNAFMGLLPE